MKMHAAYTDEPTHGGEGITRTSKPGSRLYFLEIPFPRRHMMRCTIRATSQRQALQFAAARHPTADVDGIRVLSREEAQGLMP